MDSLMNSSVENAEPKELSEKEIDTWLNLVAHILGKYIIERGGIQREGIAHLNVYLSVGTQTNAANPAALKKQGFTHIINCANDWVRTGPSFYGEQFDYYGFAAEDTEHYDILKNHFDSTAEFIDGARRTGGKVLIHCIGGTNRSAALAGAYLIREGSTLSKALECLALACGVVLTNVGFRRALIRYSHSLGRLT
eukprot:Platyproteum_vivax@DN4435_c0_g1_i1.p1